MFLQRELYIALTVMGWCMRVCVCDEISSRYWKLIFGVEGTGKYINIKMLTLT